MGRAQRWRNCLLGSSSTIHYLREYTIDIKKNSKHYDDIHKDMKRTFPLDEFFNDHIGPLSEILNSYAYVNHGMGYAQGMAFIAFILFKIYHADDPVYATEDTFYSLHHIIQVVRPAYPLNDKDKSVVRFNDNITSSVILLISKHNTQLARRVKELNIMPIFVQQNMPSLFANKFMLEDCCLLWDFIIHKNHYEMFHRTLCVLAGMILSIEPVIIHMKYENVLSIMQNRGCYKARRVISLAYSVI